MFGRLLVLGGLSLLLVSTAERSAGAQDGLQTAQAGGIQAEWARAAHEDPAEGMPSDVRAAIAPAIAFLRFWRAEMESRDARLAAPARVRVVVLRIFGEVPPGENDPPAPVKRPHGTRPATVPSWPPLARESDHAWWSVRAQCLYLRAPWDWLPWPEPRSGPPPPGFRRRSLSDADRARQVGEAMWRPVTSELPRRTPARRGPVRYGRLEFQLYQWARLVHVEPGTQPLADRIHFGAWRAARLPEFLPPWQGSPSVAPLWRWAWESHGVPGSRLPPQRLTAHQVVQALRTGGVARALQDLLPPDLRADVSFAIRRHADDVANALIDCLVRSRVPEVRRVVTRLLVLQLAGPGEGEDPRTLPADVLDVLDELPPGMLENEFEAFTMPHWVPSEVPAPPGEDF